MESATSFLAVVPALCLANVIDALPGDDLWRFRSLSRDARYIINDAATKSRVCMQQ